MEQILNLIKNNLIITLTIIFFSFAFTLNFSANGEQQFSHLADSFLHGKFYFLVSPEILSDIIPFEGRYYWPKGPFPTIILMPFVFLFKFFSLFFYQGYLQFFLVLLIFAMCFNAAKNIRYSLKDSIYLAFAFCFSSVFLGVAFISWSWYFAQVVTTFLLFLAIREYLAKKRYWLIGLFFGFILLTRMTVTLGIVFFILEIFFSRGFKKSEILSSLPNKFRRITQLMLPVFLALLVLLGYNYIRFGNPLEQGHSLCVLGKLDNPSMEHMKARDYGLLHYVHVPGNIYYSLISAPSPVFRDGTSHVLKFPFVESDPWGMSIFLTSPYLLYLFFIKNKDKISYFLLATVILIAMPLLFFYVSGANQFGYRYALDFMPFLFLLFMRNYYNQYQKLSNKLKILIIFSSFFNLYLFFTLKFF